MKKKYKKRGRKAKKLTHKEIYQEYLKERQKIRLKSDLVDKLAPKLTEKQVLTEVKRELKKGEQISRTKATRIKHIVAKTIQKEYKFSAKQVENVLNNINPIIRDTWLKVFGRTGFSGRLAANSARAQSGSLEEQRYSIMVHFKGDNLTISHYLLTASDVINQTAYYLAWVNHLKTEEDMSGDEIYGT